MRHATAAPLAFALSLTLSLAAGCASSVTTGSGGDPGNGDDAGVPTYDLSRSACATGADCDGGVCLGGSCCATIACGAECCAGGSVCLFDRCVAPGRPCHT